MALFGALHDAGQTIILVTHEPDVAARAKRHLHLRDGLVTQDLATKTTEEA